MSACFPLPYPMGAPKPGHGRRFSRSPGRARQTRSAHPTQVRFGRRRSDGPPGPRIGDRMGTDADRLTEVRERFAASEFHRSVLGCPPRARRAGRGGRLARGRAAAPEPRRHAARRHDRHPGRHRDGSRLPDDARGGDELPHEHAVGHVPAAGPAGNRHGQGPGREDRLAVRLRGGGRRGRAGTVAGPGNGDVHDHRRTARLSSRRRSPASPWRARTGRPGAASAASCCR